jgi:hypothetical protein
LTNPLISRQRIDEAYQSVSATAKKRLEESAANRQSYEKFYNTLALLAGGTVALSVTYLGFLRTVTNTPTHLKWLVASWVMLFICLACATFYSFFNISYVHFARNREYMQRVKEKNETLASELPNVPIIGISTKQELDEYIKKLQSEAIENAEGVRWHRRREKLHEFLFRACAITARASFVVGIALLLYFAVTNMGVPLKQIEVKEDGTLPTPMNNIPSVSVTGASSRKDYVVKIPCVGIVTFPASMSDADVNAACKLLHDRSEEARKKKGLPPCEMLTSSP